MSERSLKLNHQALWRAVIYIQNHLNDEIRLADVAAHAGYSPYYFHRMFRQFLGESVKSYIRRLRLENAAFRLRIEQKPIIDLAFSSGYFTHETFTRAFCKRFSVNPSRYKNWFEVRGSDQHIRRVRIVRFKRRACTFRRFTGPYEKSGRPEDASSLWRLLVQRLPLPHRPLEELELFGISHDDPTITGAHHIRYDACVALPDGVATTEPQCEISDGYYAKAEYDGPFDQLTGCYHYLIYQWCPLYNKQVHPSRPPFEQFHLVRDSPGLKTAEVSVYIPIG